MWLQIDEQTDVTLSLSACLHCLARVRKTPAFWKWVVLSLHNALQGAMVCHLSGTAELGALDDRSIRSILDWHERDRQGEVERVLTGQGELGPTYRPKSKQDEFPEQRLADTKTLFRRLHKHSDRREGGAGALLEISDAQCKSFDILHSMRNDFSHFTPKGWSIEISGLPQICLDMIDVLWAIAADPWSFRHMAESSRTELIALVRGLKSALEQVVSRA